MGIEVGGILSAQITVTHQQIRHCRPLQLGEEIHALGAAEVVEPVGVLQIFHLVLEDRIEGVTELATKLVELFSQTTNPKVNVVDAGFSPSPSATASEEVKGIRWGSSPSHDGQGRITLGLGGGC